MTRKIQISTLSLRQKTRFLPVFFLVGTIISVCGCGQTGALYLPEKPQTKQTKKQQAERPVVSQTQIKKMQADPNEY